jgi:hypothetical protein
VSTVVVPLAWSADTEVVLSAATSSSIVAMTESTVVVPLACPAYSRTEYVSNNTIYFVDFGSYYISGSPSLVDFSRPSGMGIIQ